MIFFLGEHRHPAVSGCSISGQSSLPVHRQCPAAVLMVKPHTENYYTQSDGLILLTLLCPFQCSTYRKNMFIVQRAFECKLFRLCQAHDCRVFRWSALTHLIYKSERVEVETRLGTNFIVTVTFLYKFSILLNSRCDSHLDFFLWLMLLFLCFAVLIRRWLSLSQIQLTFLFKFSSLKKIIIDSIFWLSLFNLFLINIKPVHLMACLIFSYHVLSWCYHMGAHIFHVWFEQWNCCLLLYMLCVIFLSRYVTAVTTAASGYSYWHYGRKTVRVLNTKSPWRSHLEILRARGGKKKQQQPGNGWDTDESRRKLDGQTDDRQELWNQVAVTTIYGSPW